MPTLEKCSHGIDMLPSAECLECELLWHQNLVATHTKVLARHQDEVRRLEARIEARRQQERAQGVSVGPT